MNRLKYLGVGVGLACLMACAQTPVAKTEPAPRPQASYAPAGENAVVVPASVLRDTHAQAADAPTRYVVQKGDTLWDIASRFLADPWLWPEIWLVNSFIKNPHLIYPGDIVSLEWIDGRPRLSIDRGGVTRLSPRVRSTPIEQALPTLPMDAIRNFLKSARFIDEEAFQAAPYVLTPADGHLMAAEGMDVFARGFADDPREQWQLIRAGQQYIDPVTGEILGREGIAVSLASLRQAGDPARYTIHDSQREALRGDRLFPLPEETELADLLLMPAPEELEARVVAGFDVTTVVGQYQIVSVNAGQNRHLKPGMVFEVFAPDQWVEDSVRGAAEQVALPGLYRGVAVVFAVDERVSHALVMSAVQAIRAGDYMRSPAN